MKQELRIRNKKIRTKSIIRNSLFIIRKSDGFTLIELLVVILVIFSVGVLIVSVLFSALRGTNKTNTIDTVRRNGNSAITQMSRMIRYAQSFNGVSTSTDPSVYITDCTVRAPTPTPTPTQYSNVNITSFDGGQTIFSCPPSASTIASISATTSVSLIDTSSVDVSNCYFTCSQDSIISPPNIGINFTLTQKNTSNFFENKASASFQTSVSVRNY